MRGVMSSIACLFLAASVASAQRCSLELLGGYSFQPYTIKGEACPVLSAANGGNEFIRFNYFFSEHFGAFAQIGIEAVSSDEAQFFGAMNKADGGKYLYSFRSYGNYKSEMGVFCLGAACRWDAGIFRFTPRLGIGIGDFDGFNYSYERRERNGASGPEYFSFNTVSKSEGYDYLINNRRSYTNPAPMLVSTDFQISINPDKRVFIFIEPGITFAPFGTKVKSSKYASVRAYDPANWVEAVAYADVADAWTMDTSSGIFLTEHCSISPYFHLSVGIGVNFGYRKRR